MKDYQNPLLNPIKNQSTNPPHSFQQSHQLGTLNSDSILLLIQKLSESSSHTSSFKEEINQNLQNTFMLILIAYVLITLGTISFCIFYKYNEGKLYDQIQFKNRAPSSQRNTFSDQDDFSQQNSQFLSPSHTVLEPIMVQETELKSLKEQMCLEYDVFLNPYVAQFSFIMNLSAIFYLLQIAGLLTTKIDDQLLIVMIIMFTCFLQMVKTFLVISHATTLKSDFKLKKYKKKLALVALQCFSLVFVVVSSFAISMSGLGKSQMVQDFIKNLPVLQTFYMLWYYFKTKHLTYLSLNELVFLQAPIQFLTAYIYYFDHSQVLVDSSKPEFIDYQESKAVMMVKIGVYVAGYLLQGLLWRRNYIKKQDEIRNIELWIIELIKERLLSHMQQQTNFLSLELFNSIFLKEKSLEVSELTCPICFETEKISSLAAQTKQFQVERQDLFQQKGEEQQLENVISKKLQKKLREYCLTPCGHLYHLNCLEQWYTRGSRKCPACREVFLLDIRFQNIINSLIQQ